MSCPNYKIIFNDETKYVVQDITEEPVVRVIPARGEPGPQGEKGPQGEQGPQGIQGEQGPKGEDGKNFEPTVVSALPTTGDEGKLYLTPKAHTTQTATGNPITATITEEAGKMESFKLDGDTYQQSYEGKNLFDIQDNLRASDSGLNFSFSNNELTVSGTPIRGWANVTNLISVSLPAGQYTLSLSKQLAHRVYLHIVYTDATSEDTFIIGTGNTSATITFGKDVNLIRLDFSFMDVGVALDESFSIQLEAGSTATSFEPYVGGQASPNPDYPQTIQTVTGTQTVEIQGKNIYENTGWRRGQYDTGVWRADAFDGQRATTPLIPIKGGSYTISLNSADNTASFININYFDSNKVWLGNRSNLGLEAFATTDRVKTFTLPDEANYLAITIRPYGSSTSVVYDYASETLLMLEAGSTATAYAPYSHQTLPLDLGNIELCGLGDDGNGNPLYKDRIYRDGDDWKVHKKCKTITLDGSESWQYSGSYNFFYAGNISGMATPVDERVACYCRTHKGLTSSSSGPDFATEASNYPYAVDVHTTQSLARIKDTRFSSIQAIKAWLAQNNTTIYYVVRSATDTTITDTALIAQLEAIRTALLQNGASTITNTATGSNLAGDMEIGYYGYNPRNRYDKWLWLDINNEYEQIGS